MVREREGFSSKGRTMCVCLWDYVVCVREREMGAA